MNKERGYHVSLYAVFLFYVFILLMMLLINRRSYHSINIVPFRTIITYLASDDIIAQSFKISNLAGNILLFLPLGIYFIIFFKNKKIGINTLRIIGISCIIEIIQYIFQRGASDIDDVILNGLGGFIGICLYEILLFVLKSEIKVRHFVAVFAPIAGIVLLVMIMKFS